MKPLTGDRIHLRMVEIEDLENLYTWENDAKTGLHPTT